VVFAGNISKRCKKCASIKHGVREAINGLLKVANEFTLLEVHENEFAIFKPVKKEDKLERSINRRFNG